MTDPNITGAMACAKCGRVFPPPHYTYDLVENRKRKRAYQQEVNAHMRQCSRTAFSKKPIEGGNGNAH